MYIFIFILYFANFFPIKFIVLNVKSNDKILHGNVRVITILALVLESVAKITVKKISKKVSKLNGFIEKM